MSKWLIRSGFILSLLLVATGSAWSATDLDDPGSFNWSEINNMIRRGADSTIAGGQFEDDQEIESATDDSSLPTGGDGFYMAIYRDTVLNPSRLVEEQVKDRFGIDLKVEVVTSKEQGQYVFLDYFNDWRFTARRVTAPLLSTSLQSDCVRVKAAQVDEQAKRWALLKRRLGERQKFLQDPTRAATADQVKLEVLLRLAKSIDKETVERVKSAVEAIPEYRNLESQQVLLDCYRDLSNSVDFELQLQSILYPSRKKLEVLQTFMNGRLDDFTDTAFGTDISAFRNAFPQYDLLFDIDVIDMIFFGTAVGTDSGTADSGGGRAPASKDFQNYQDIQESTPVISEGGSGGRTGGNTTTSSASTSSNTNVSGGRLSENPFASSGGEFGTGSGDFAGPLCVETRTGLELDFSPVDEEEEILPSSARPSVRPSPSSTTGSSSSTTTPPPGTPTAGSEPPVQESDVLSDEGSYQFGKNRRAICEGTTGVNLGNDFLTLLLCIDISFSKLGKTWQTVRQDNCIACHLYAMNRTFEELVLKSSVRPHKNTGTIMESAICEDGYGDDIGFFSFIEWVPVKFYEEICYPQGGVTDTTFAEMVGYPEIVNRVSKKGLDVICEADFTDEKARERCKDAIGGNQLTYEQFRNSYLESLNQDPSDIDKDSNLWARLVGDQGIAQREVHKFLYRIGKDQEWYQEGEVLQQDFKKRMADLRKKMEDIKRDPSLPPANATRDAKGEQLLCLKGYFYGGQETGQPKGFNCRNYPDTFKQLGIDIAAERERVDKITERWNKRSKDFNQENSCAVFSGSGPIDAFWDDFSGKLSGDYYYETNTRKTQSVAEQVTGQIAANTEIEDLDRLFNEINQQVEEIADGQTQEQLKQEFEANQERALHLYGALGPELMSFRSTLRAYTDWWSKMVTEKDFISKGGQRINVLQSFVEKLR